MAFQNTPNAARLEIRCLLDNEKVENVMWYTLVSFGLSELQALVDTIGGWFVAEVLPLLSNNLIYQSTYARGMRTASDLEAVSLTDSGEDGGDTVQALPNNDSFSCELGSNFTGRSRRGRQYIMGLTEAKTIGSFVDPAFTLAYLAALAGYGTAASAIDWTWVINSLYSGVDGNGKPIPRASGVTTPIEYVAKFDNVVDSQRRRLPGRGD